MAYYDPGEWGQDGWNTAGPAHTGFDDMYDQGSEHNFNQFDPSGGPNNAIYMDNLVPSGDMRGGPVPGDAFYNPENTYNPGFSSSYYDPTATQGQMSFKGGAAGGSRRAISNSAWSPNNLDEEEPPLLEELGINFEHITQKTLAVLHPMKSADPQACQDSDLAGPLVFAIAFGAALLLAGKVHFNYIYGIGVMGSLGMYCLLNLMSLNGIGFFGVVSVLGYCLLPLVGLSTVSVILSLKGAFGLVFSLVTVSWCSWSSSKLFVAALGMAGQQMLIAYPCALLYGVFALLTVF